VRLREDHREQAGVDEDAALDFADALGGDILRELLDDR